MEDGKTMKESHVCVGNMTYRKFNIVRKILGGAFGKHLYVGGMLL